MGAQPVPHNDRSVDSSIASDMVVEKKLGSVAGSGCTTGAQMKHNIHQSQFTFCPCSKKKKIKILNILSRLCVMYSYYTTDSKITFPFGLLRLPPSV